MDIRNFFKKKNPTSSGAGAGAGAGAASSAKRKSPEKAKEEEKVKKVKTTKEGRKPPTTTTTTATTTTTGGTVELTPKKKQKISLSVEDKDKKEKGGGQKRPRGIREEEEDRDYEPTTTTTTTKKKASSSTTTMTTSPKPKELRERALKRLSPLLASLPKTEEELEARGLFSVRAASDAFNPYNQVGGVGRDEEAPPNHGKKLPLPRAGDEHFLGLTFVITGSLDSLYRSEAEDLIKRHSGRVTAAVSGKTDFLVVGKDSGTSKVKGAREKAQTCRIIDEDGLLSLLKTKENTTTTTTTTTTTNNRTTSKPTPTPTPTPIPAASAPAVKAKVNVPSSSSSSDSSGMLWVQKHKPREMQEMVGNSGHVRLMRQWLRDWENVHIHGQRPMPSPGGGSKDMSKKAVLLSGAPGVGKTTCATLLAKQLGFNAIEVNASDTRGKSDRDRNKGLSGKMSNQIRELITNQQVDVARLALTSQNKSKSNSSPPPPAKKTLIIMDECDGMSGSDRGGIAEIVDCIKKTKVPIICICNDKYNPKMRPLRNAAIELDFRKPTRQEVAKRMLAICQKEGLQTNQMALEQLAEASNGDLRILLGHLQNFALTRSSLSYDDAKHQSGGGLSKDADMSPFAVAQILLGFDGSRFSIAEQTDMVFQDADLIPLLVQENYLNHRPRVAGNDLQRLKVISKASEAISHGDVVNNAVRGQGEWGLMPFGNLISTVYPSIYMRGSREIFGLYPGEANMARFSAWLGNNSSKGKQTRVLSEVHSHVQCSQYCQADRLTLLMEYLSLFRRKLTGPLIKSGKEGIQEVLELMDEYCLTREDFDSVFELTKFKSKLPYAQDLTKNIPTQVKTAFTRQFNAASHRILSGMGDSLSDPFSQKGKKGKKGKAAAKKKKVKKEAEDDYGEGDDGEMEEEEEQLQAPKLSNKRLQAINFTPREEPKKGKAKGRGGKANASGSSARGRKKK